MPEPSSPSSEGGQVRGLLVTLLRYAEARGKLFKIESQEASQLVAQLISRIITATVLLTVAWLLAVPALVSLIAEALHRPWQQVALAGAGLHLLIGIGFLNAARRRWRQAELFEESLNQFQKDREWASRHQPPLN